MAHLNALKLAQWNCCGIRGKLPQLQALAPSLDIINIQESLLSPCNSFWLRGFNIVRSDIYSTHERGVCILVNNKLNYTTLNLSSFSHTSLELLGIMLTHDNLSLAIVNIYRHPNQSTPSSILDALFHFLSSNFDRVLISGDFNAHHTWWGCDYDDQAGRILSHLFDAYNLVTINDGQPTLLLPPNFRRSIIDLVVVSADFAPLCHSYTDRDTAGSDHFPIFTIVGGTPSKKRKFKYKLKINKKDTQLLNLNLDASYDVFASDISPDTIHAYNQLENHIKHHVYSFVPPSARYPRSVETDSSLRSPPWWNADCQAAVDERRSATKAYTRAPTFSNYLAYKKVRSSCTKTLKKMKRRGWRTFCAQFDFKTPTPEVWSLIKLFKRRSLSCSPSSETSFSSLFQDAMLKLCPMSCLHVIWDSVEALESEDVNDSRIFGELEAPLTSAEYYAALNSMKLKSSPGLDQVDYNIISSLPEKYALLLLQLFNRILSEGVFPPQWKQSLIALIPKPDGKGVRPISLLSCYLKLMEKMIYTRLQWFIESRHILSDFQFGFRADRSCLDNLAILFTDIHEGFARGEITVAAFLDIKGAFDNVIPNILIQDLKDIGIPARLRGFILNLISERQIFFVVDGILKGPFHSHKGTPQGSTLSPILFDIYLKDIEKHLHRDTRILLYADDIVIYSTSRSPIVAHNSIQISLDRINFFLRNKGLDLSPEKSQWLLFSRRRSHLVLPPLMIFRAELPMVSVVRFLGIFLDSKLTGKAHFQHLIRKGSALVDILASLAGTWWGSHPHLLLTLYRSVFRGAIEYGCQIFKLRNNLSTFAKIERLQYRAIRIAMGYRLSTPINVMLFEAKEVPLKLRFNYLTHKYLVKCFARLFNPVICRLDSLRLTLLSSHRRTRVRLLRTFPLLRLFVSLQSIRSSIYSSAFLPAFFFDYDSSAFIPSLCFDMFPADKDLSPAVIHNKFLELSSPYRENAVSFYTDGSKLDTDHSLGAAVYSPDFNLRITHRLPSETSVFSAEAWAILLAIDASADFNCDKVVIFSDSKSVLDSLVSPFSNYNKNYLIHRIKNKLFKAHRDGRIIHLFWLPAHRGIPGNETVDFLAKFAITRGYKPYFKIPYTDFQFEARDILNVQFLTYLKDSARLTGSQHATLYQSSSSSKPWYFDKSLNRKEIVLINRIRSNHYNLNYSLFRKNIVKSPACLCGDSRQDINHIVFYCPITIPKSSPLRSFLSKSFPHHPIDIFPLLSNPCPKLIRLLLAYLKANDLAI